MTIYFITGNAGKFAEASAILPRLKQLDVNLREIQSLDPRKVIEAKLQAAFDHHEGPFIVEDVSLELACLGGLPGPLIKWFIHVLEPHGIYELAHKMELYDATSSVTYGYAKNRTEITYFSASTGGTIVPPNGQNGFGFDPIFMPDGFDQTQAQMSFADKNRISARRQALEKLKASL